MTLIDIFLFRILAEVDAEEQHQLALQRAAEVEAERILHQEMLRVASEVSSLTRRQYSISVLIRCTLASFLHFPAPAKFQK